MNVAVPSGMWLKLKKMAEVTVDEDDKARLIELRKRHKNILRNIWNPFDKNYEGKKKCNTVNRLVYYSNRRCFTCPYVHVKIGNVYEQFLKEIRDYGLSDILVYKLSCLAGENKDFIRKYMSFENQSIFNPAHANDIFDDDYVENQTWQNNYASKYR